MRQAVFLDRDGVLNDITVQDNVPHPPDTLEDFRLLEGVRETCEQLHAAGYLLIVVTNQPDVARGTQSVEIVEEINRQVRTLLPVDDIYTCYHDSKDNCDCRKPKPGMLVAASEKWLIDLDGSFMVGDRYTDILAGAAAGCRTIFIERGAYGKKDRCQPDWVAADLVEAARIIQAEKQKAI